MLGNFSPAEPPEQIPAIAAVPEPSEWLHKSALQPFLEETREERLAEVQRIVEHVELSLTELLQRADEEIGKANEDKERGIAGADGRLAQAENRHAELLARRERRRQELERQRSLSLQAVERIASVLVLPHPEREAPDVRRMRPNLETEATAMQVVMEHEQAQGRQVYDVHEKNLGYDITSLDLNSGELRLIEVKGLSAATGTILLTPNERRVAEDRRDCYWLYVVTNCALPAPQSGAARQAGLPAPRPATFWVYAIKCEDGSFYIGHTDDIPRRFNEHRQGIGANWTKHHRPLYIVHYESFTSREEAIKREHDLKTGFGRKWLKDHIGSGRARQAGTHPIMQEPIKDPAGFPWQEVTKVAHYWLEVNALSAVPSTAQAGMTKPMMVREDRAPYGREKP
jgi:predicted GIY-YIG superfamily endonuclease